MGEYDNAGFPLSYCLLSTAAALDIGKRTKALNAWGEWLRDKYGVNPRFAHTDKDMAEIGMLRGVWDPKLQLCWWHMREAVKVRLAKSKLSTSPYNANRAHAEFAFINVLFRPTGQADNSEHEGGLADEEGTTIQPQPGPNSIPLRIPITPSLRQTLDATPHPLTQPEEVNRRPTLSLRPVSQTEATRESSGRLTIKLPQRLGGNSEQPAMTPGTDKTVGERNIFCPPEYRQPIIDLIEGHLCAHPLIPGYSAPTKEGIREWAVKQMYEYCYKHHLPEVWAYLWENWYRPSRWEIWARSCCPEIPILKTTLILESQ